MISYSSVVDAAIVTALALVVELMRGNGMPAGSIAYVIGPTLTAAPALVCWSTSPVPPVALRFTPAPPYARPTVPLVMSDPGMDTFAVVTPVHKPLPLNVGTGITDPLPNAPVLLFIAASVNIALPPPEGPVAVPSPVSAVR